MNEFKRVIIIPRENDVSTFDVSNVSIETALLPAATLGDDLQVHLGAPIEACGANLRVCTVPVGSAYGPLPHHGFLAAVHHAFAQHYPLILSPDDFWLCIAQGIAIHMELNAGAFRTQFVDDEGQALIQIRRDEFVKGSPDNDWPGCFSEFSHRIAEHMGKKRDLVIANFSTTGPVEKAASEVVLMSAMRRYFRYEMLTLCGIPRVTLLGTVDDWRTIRRRAEVLAEFELEWWTKALLPVLDQLVATAAERPDRLFWQSFYKWEDSSGGPYLSGWVNALFPYLQPEGESGVAATPVRNDWLSRRAAKVDSPFGHGPKPEEFPLGLSKAPLLWKFLRDTYSMEFVGGFVGVSQDPANRSLRPAIGWAVCDAVAP